MRGTKINYKKNIEHKNKKRAHLTHSYLSVYGSIISGYVRKTVFQMEHPPSDVISLRLKTGCQYVRNPGVVIEKNTKARRSCN